MQLLACPCSDGSDESILSPTLAAFFAASSRTHHPALNSYSEGMDSKLKTKEEVGEVEVLSLCSLDNDGV